VRATIARPFGSVSGPPFFDYGEVVSAFRQEDGLYTVTRNVKDADAANTVVDVPSHRLDFTKPVLRDKQ
jgi:hypothetical protein